MNYETQTKTFYKRKKLNLNVKRNFQIWLLKRIMATILASSLLAALILYFYARSEITSSFFDAHLKIRRVSDLLLPVVAAGSLVSLLAGMALAIFLPQKIAGPIYRVEQDLIDVQEGDLTAVIRLRQNDILQELVDTVNETTDSLRVKIREIQTTQETIVRHLPPDPTPELADALAAQEQLLKQLHT